MEISGCSACLSLILRSKWFADTKNGIPKMINLHKTSIQFSFAFVYRLLMVNKAKTELMNSCLFPSSYSMKQLDYGLKFFERFQCIILIH